MKKSTFAILLGLVLVGPARAEDLSAHLGLFANAKEVFRPLLADPREIQLALRLVTPVSRNNFGEVEVGEYFGLYRWALPWQDSYLQWSVAGGVFSRFDLVKNQTENEVNDFSANMPIDLRVKKWGLRVLPYHISSHLGDDYIRRTGAVTDKYSFDAYKTLISYEPWTCLRLYGGSIYAIRYGKDYLGHYAIQSGAEWTSRWWAHNHAQLYWATDYQAWERIGWNAIVNTQLGVHLANHPDDPQKISIFTEYGAGHMVYGQFFQQQESHWVLGIRFDIP